jgi:hypothetical protein
MKKNLFFALSALMLAWVSAPAPAVAECYESPEAFVVWSKCEFKRICADPKKEKRVNWCKSIGLEGADLSGAVMDDIVLHHSNLKGVNLEKADLRGADLSNTDLSGANLKRARLNKAIIKDANLTGADLSGANLEGADLERSILAGAKIKGTNFGAVRMSDAIWIDGKTRCKGGSVGECKK